MRKPYLNQRTGRREHQIGQTHGPQQQQQDAPHWLLRPHGLEPRIRHNGQHQRRGQQRGPMHPGLRAGLPPRQPMGVTVAPEKNHLKKQHARRPHPGTPAKPWQNKFADHRLDLKQEKRPEKTHEAENDVH